MLIIYTIIIFLYSYWLYKKNAVYYRLLEYFDPEKFEKVNVRNLYPEFAVLDKLSFVRILIGNFFISIPKFIIDVFFALMQIIRLNQHIKNLKNPSSDLEEWKILSETISFWTKCVLIVNGINVSRKNLPYEQIYKKYLGEDYTFNPNEKYSLLISNHTGFYDMIINMSIHSCGFLAKDETKYYPFVGTIAKGINCLFVKRESEEDRAKIFVEIEKRQKDFYEGNILTPLLIFPEGTTTNGKYILKFKKGAFYNLLPVKPQLILLDDNLDYSIGIGVNSPVFNYFRSLCYLGTKVNLCELPFIKPTDYMWKNYSHLGEQKWKIFAEVTRKIMCEIGNLEPSNRTFRDCLHYEKCLIKGSYRDENRELLKV